MVKDTICEQACCEVFVAVSLERGGVAGNGIGESVRGWVTEILSAECGIWGVFLDVMVTRGVSGSGVVGTLLCRAV